jgi:hypothetical protein
MPDYPFTDTTLRHFHIDKGGALVRKPNNAITDVGHECTSETGHGHETASGGLTETGDTPGQAMPAVVQQHRFLLENMKHTRDECTSLCAQKDKHDAPTLKQMQSVRWFSTSTGLAPRC